MSWAVADPGTPSALRSHLSQQLGSDPEAAQVLARWDRWGADLVTALAEVYPQAGVAERVVGLIADGHAARSADLRARDRDRVLSPDWFQRPDAVGYAAYADRFAGTLNGVVQKVDYLRELGVTYLHLMPLLQPRPGENDGGYAVMDYGRVREDLGTMEDLAALAETLHDNGISLTLDLVLNHVAAEHAWAVAARGGDPRYRDYFYVYPDRTEPDAYERSLPEVFPDFAPGNFTWDEELQGWVWTTFNAWQWDVNWSNPDVLCEFIDGRPGPGQPGGGLPAPGRDRVHLEAVGHRLPEPARGPCDHPGAARRGPDRGPQPDLQGRGDRGPVEAGGLPRVAAGTPGGSRDIAYHNSLMVQIWSALASRDARLMAVAMSRFPDIPTTTGWATYLRCHDDIGWAIDDGDCAAIGWNGFAHRGFLSDFFIGAHPASFAEGAAFQENPATGDRRISGSAASLAGLGTARTAGQRHMAIDRVLLGYAMVLGFGGIPLIYMGDELALLNDDDYVTVPEHADDNRWMHRPVMPWDVAETRHDPSTDAGRTWAGMRRLIQVRTALDSLHGSVPTRVHTTSHPAVVLFVRTHPAGDMVQVYNVSDWNVTIPEGDVQAHAHGLTFDRVGGREVRPHDGLYSLRPYTAWWLTRPDA